METNKPNPLDELLEAVGRDVVPWDRVAEPAVAGQVTDLEIAAKEILRMRDLLEEILASHTGQSIERIHADTDRDFVLEAQEALEYGIIDDVISSRQLTDRSGPIR